MCKYSCNIMGGSGSTFTTRSGEALRGSYCSDAQGCQLPQHWVSLLHQRYFKSLFFYFSDPWEGAGWAGPAQPSEISLGTSLRSAL